MKAKDGDLVQYAKHGGGFVATTSTIRNLKPGVYRIDIVNQVAVFMPHDVVTDNLLRLPDSKSDEVITEIERFWTLKERFQKFGFSHKRGFLLHGPPGSGKTSTIAVVMKQMVADGGIVILGNTHPHTLSGMLQDLREVEPERPLVVVLEDIDTIIEQYGESETLSILDGESSVANVVFLATTNYPENLDGRVTNRPSRFDKVVQIGMPNADARRVYIKSRGMDLTDDDLERWVETTAGFSVAHIKELVISVYCFGNDLEAEAERLAKMAKTPKSSDGKKGVGFGAD